VRYSLLSISILIYRAILLTFSFSFLSLFLFSTWYQSHFFVAFTRQNPAFLRCYGFTVSSPKSQTLLHFLPSSESSSPGHCSTHGQLHWIDLIKICPLPPESESDLARAPTHRQKFLVLQSRTHVLPRTEQHRHAHPHTSCAFFLSAVPRQP
jgi:hypothetical protein